MNEDPIVAEVRRIREQRASQFGYDIHKIFADLRANRRAPGQSHPLVADASQWSPKDALTVGEEPPRGK